MLAHEQFPVRELVDLGSQAAQGGFHLLATSDHFQPWQANEGHSGEAWVTLGALSSRVSRSWMGTTAMAPADDLSGTISATPDIGFTSALSNSFVNLAPTQINDFLSLAPITTTPGTHTKVVTLAAYDVNASNYAAQLPIQTLTITSTVFGFAQAAINSATVIDFGTARGGRSSTQMLSIENTASQPAEALDASVVAVANGAAASGSISLLMPGQSDASDILVGFAPTAGGYVDGTVTIGFQSDGVNTDGDGTTTLLPQQVEVRGTIYREAQAGIALTNSVLHVGDSGADTLTVTNIATPDGYSENLVASMTAAAGDISAGPEQPDQRDSRRKQRQQQFGR